MWKCLKNLIACSTLLKHRIGALIWSQEEPKQFDDRLSVVISFFFDMFTLYLGKISKFPYIFIPIWGRFPIWWIFFRWVAQASTSQPDCKVVIFIENHSWTARFVDELRVLERALVGNRRGKENYIYNTCLYIDSPVIYMLSAVVSLLGSFLYWLSITIIKRPLVQTATDSPFFGIWDVESSRVFQFSLQQKLGIIFPVWENIAGPNQGLLFGRGSHLSEEGPGTNHHRPIESILMELNYEKVLVVKPRRSWLGQDDKTKSDKKPEEETQGVWELRVNEHQRKCQMRTNLSFHIITGWFIWFTPFYVQHFHEVSAISYCI